MHEEVSLILSSFNLSKSEAALYLAALETGPATAYQLAKMTGVKQATAYVLARELLVKGFLTSEAVGKRQHFVPVAPRTIINAWKGKLESFEAIAPELNAFYERSTGHPRALVYNGAKEVEQVYHEMLSPRGTGKHELLLISTVSAFASPYDHLFPMWQRCARDKRNTIRDLVLDEADGHNYGKIMQALGNPNYQVRYHSGAPFGKTDILMYQNKVALFSFGDRFFATVHESSELAQTFRALFNVAWVNAKKI